MIAALNALLGPDQLNTSEGVTAWTVLASTGGNRADRSLATSAIFAVSVTT